MQWRRHVVGQVMFGTWIKLTFQVQQWAGAVIDQYYYIENRGYNYTLYITLTPTNYANVAYDLLTYNMAAATLTIQSNSKWRHCIYIRWSLSFNPSHSERFAWNVLTKTLDLLRGSSFVVTLARPSIGSLLNTNNKSPIPICIITLSLELTLPILVQISHLHFHPVSHVLVQHHHHHNFYHPSFLRSSTAG